MEEIEGRDIFAADFIRQEQSIMDSESPSEIQRFFEGTTIFVTGGTGFLGKVLIEKLLGQCSKLNRIYILMRPKKEKSAEERFEQQFDGPLFDNMKKANPNYRKQVFIIPGDMAKEDIMSEEDRQMLIQNVDIVFHCAATVRFDEKIRKAFNINIRGTKYMLDMAHEMKNLKAFLHVSTAYSNCPRREIDEKFYPPPYDYDKITSLLRVLEDNVLDQITTVLLDKFPNTYAFTKMIAEDVVREYGKGLPIGVLRPSIVISTYKQPIAGWINNFYGPQGVVFGAGVGLLRTLHCNPKVLADMVPVDLVINALLALAWDLGQTKGDNPNFERVSWKEALDNNNSDVEKRETTEEIPVLNYVSSERNPITWGEFLHYNYKAGRGVHSPLQLWYSSLTLNTNLYVDRAYRVVCHYGPALVIDAIAMLLRRKPILWNSYKRIHKFSEVISYFCTSQWKFKEENVIKLWSKISPKDRVLFNFDIKDLQWEQYFQCYIRGMRVYLVNDTITPPPYGRMKALRLKIYHYLLVTFLNLLLFYILYKIYTFLFI